MESGDSGLEFRISGFEVRVSGFGFRDSGLGFRVSDFGFRVSGFGFRGSGFGFRVLGFEFQVSGFGVRIYNRLRVCTHTSMPGSIKREGREREREGERERARDTERRREKRESGGRHLGVRRFRRGGLAGSAGQAISHLYCHVTTIFTVMSPHIYCHLTSLLSCQSNAVSIAREAHRAERIYQMVSLKSIHTQTRQLKFMTRNSIIKLTGLWLI